MFLIQNYWGWGVCVCVCGGASQSSNPSIPLVPDLYLIIYTKCLNNNNMHLPETHCLGVIHIVTTIYQHTSTHTKMFYILVVIFS